MTIMYLGNEEVAVIQLPRGFHALAAKNEININAVALDAIIDRVRSACLADHMSKSVQTKFGQKSLHYCAE
jgi:hypothetical protein